MVVLVFPHGIHADDVFLPRKVKRELIAEISESSWVGAILSILTAVVVIWLIYSELTNYLQVSTVSRLVIDQNQGGSDTLQVLADLILQLRCTFQDRRDFLPFLQLHVTRWNLSQMVFSVDFPKLNCEHLHIQATNFMGTRKAGLATKVLDSQHRSRDRSE